MFDIRTFGAAPEKNAKENQRAIQAAVDAAYAVGGGTVTVPAGKFVTGNIELKSNVCLTVEAGAVLAGSKDWRDYEFTHEPNSWASDVGGETGSKGYCMVGFLWAEDSENITVTGPGIIDGQGAGHETFPANDDPARRRPMLILPIRCRNVRVTDIQLKDPAMFAFYGVLCRRIWLRGISIDSWESENGDGLDFNGSEEVMISDCDLRTGDDAIGLKCNYPNRPCRDYTITNCRLSSVWAGLRIGPESTADMKDIVLSNCVFHECGDAIKIQACSAGQIEHVRVENCVLRDVHRPVFLTANRYRLSRYDESIRPRCNGVKNIVISGLTVETSRGGEEYMRSLMVISGTEKEPVEDITLRNLKICFEGGGTTEHAARTGIQEYLDYSVIYPDIFSIPGRFPSAGPFLRHIRGLRIENCDFSVYEKDARPMFFAADVQGAVIRDVRVSGCEGGLTQVDSDIQIKDCDFDVKYLEGAGLRLYREGQEVSREVDAYLDTTASMVDRAEKGTVLTTIPADAWEKNGDTWKTGFTADGAKLLYLNFYGNMELFVNGMKCASHALPRFYTERMKWACDISGAVQDGETELLIRWEDPNDVGGLTSLLPFGAFTPLPVGLVAPAVVLGE